MWRRSLLGLALINSVRSGYPTFNSFRSDGSVDRSPEMDRFTRPSPALDPLPIIHLDFLTEDDLIPVLPLLRHVGELRVASPRAPALDPRHADLVTVIAGRPWGTVVERVREHRDRTRVALLVLSAERHIETELQVLRAGADEYIGLPISTELFCERVRAVLRRTPSIDRAGTVQSVSLDTLGRHLRVEDVLVELSPTEHRLITYLYERCNTWVNTNELYTQIVGGAPRYDSSAVRVHVSNIRRKLGTAAWCLCTQRGRGVKLMTHKSISVEGCQHPPTARAGASGAPGPERLAHSLVTAR